MTKPVAACSSPASMPRFMRRYWQRVLHQSLCGTRQCVHRVHQCVQDLVERGSRPCRKLKARELGFLVEYEYLRLECLNEASNSGFVMQVEVNVQELSARHRVAAYLELRNHRSVALLRRSANPLSNPALGQRHHPTFCPLTRAIIPHCAWLSRRGNGRTLFTVRLMSLRPSQADTVAMGKASTPTKSNGAAASYGSPVLEIDLSAKTTTTEPNAIVAGPLRPRRSLRLRWPDTSAGRKDERAARTPARARARLRSCMR